MELDLAVIVMFGGNFAMAGYAFCDGQLLSISQNTALFSLLGTYYGGNGQNTFALPDLRGRVPIHTGGGQGPGLSPYVLGQMAGTENVTLNQSQMPGHTHTLYANTGAATTNVPTNAYFAAGPATGSGPNATTLKSFTSSAPNTTLGVNSMSTAGGNQPFSIIQPYLAVNFVIALQGIFPSRN